MHARERRAKRKKRGRQPEKIKDSLSFFVPLPSRAFSHARDRSSIKHIYLENTVSVNSQTDN